MFPCLVRHKYVQEAVADFLEISVWLVSGAKSCVCTGSQSSVPVTRGLALGGKVTGGLPVM